MEELLYKIETLRQFRSHLEKEFQHRQPVGKKIFRIVYHYPESFRVLIMSVIEMNESIAVLINKEMTYFSETRRLVPVMLIRTLIDIAFTLQGYLIYPNKKAFINNFEKGRQINQLPYNGKNFSTSYCKQALSDVYPELIELFKDCNEWIHPNFDLSKYPSVTPIFGNGRYGFRGKVYNYSPTDFTEEELINGEIPDYDYEEECDIVDYAIYVNSIIIDLFKRIEKIELA